MIDRIQHLIDEAKSFTTDSLSELEAFRIKFLGKKKLTLMDEQIRTFLQNKKIKELKLDTKKN